MLSVGCNIRGFPLGPCCRPLAGCQWPLFCGAMVFHLRTLTRKPTGPRQLELHSVKKNATGGALWVASLSKGPAFRFHVSVPRSVKSQETKPKNFQIPGPPNLKAEAKQGGCSMFTSASKAWAWRSRICGSWLAWQKRGWRAISMTARNAA